MTAPSPGALPANHPDQPWRFARLLSAPHRLAFFAGGLGLALSALWWLLAWGALLAGLPLPWALAPGAAHGLLLAGSFMPMFIVGFLFTAGPRWLGLGEFNAERLRWPVQLFGAGWLLALFGFHLGAGLAAAGLLLVSAAWAWLLGLYLGLIRASRAPDQLHARAVAAVCTLGLAALALASLALALGQWAWLRLAVQLLLWAWLAPCFAIVSHRMLPFFSAAVLPALQVWKPNWVLGAMAGALGLAALGSGADVLGLVQPAWLLAAQALPLAAASALLLWLALRWGLRQSWSNRLLAMLHGGFVWFGLALGLLALDRALRAAGWAGLGLAPLHALTLGYLGCTLIAMITRVSAGHSGRALAVDALAWRLYLLLQLTVLLRVGAALWPAGFRPLSLAAALGWALVCGQWAWRHCGWFGRPRIDGRGG